MIKITVIGSGNVAHHLIKAFDSNSGIELVQVYARKPESLQGIIAQDKIISDFKALQQADVFIISVSDDAILEVSSKLPFSGRLVVHTSGTKPLNILSHHNRMGVFYPLQTFSKSKEVDFKNIPICLEAQNHQDLELLKSIANSISDKVFEIDSEKRKSLHVSAVFVSNFVNHLYTIADEICTDNQIPFEVLKPLIQEVAQKINYLSPKEAQTGPAKRGDMQTINAHLDFLESQPEKQAIYKLLTQAIQNQK
jgi:predicted short-subunit dehydrogenase-like oxidoreductase (DUF2520 family)